MSGHLLRPFLNRPLGYGNRYAANMISRNTLRVVFDHFSFPDSPETRVQIFARLLFVLVELCNAYDRSNDYAPRYRMLPYLYSLLYEAHKTALPVMRPLFLEFPEALVAMRTTA